MRIAKRFISALILSMAMTMTAAMAATSTAYFVYTSTKTISGSTTSASATFTSADQGGDCLRIFNSTTAIAFVKYGKGAQTATSADLPIAPGAVEVIGISEGVDTVAVILSTGTGSVYVNKGTGL